MAKRFRRDSHTGDGHRETAHHSLAFDNSNVSDLQHMVANLQKDVELRKCELKSAHENSRKAYMAVRAESNEYKRVIQQLTIDKTNLLQQQAMNGPNPLLQQQLQHLEQQLQHAQQQLQHLEQKLQHAQQQLHQQQQQLQGQQQYIQQMEERLGTANWEKEHAEMKLAGEIQARAQLITKIGETNGVNHTLAQKVLQLEEEAQLMGRCSTDLANSQRLHAHNQELQRRIYLLSHENEVLRRVNASGGERRDSRTPGNCIQVEQSLNESKDKCERLANEKIQLQLELNAAKENGERLKTQLEDSAWMNKMMSDQIKFYKENNDLWIEQSRSLSAYLSKANGGMFMMQQPPNYAPPPHLQHQQQSLAAPTPAAVFHRPPSPPNGPLPLLSLNLEDPFN